MPSDDRCGSQAHAEARRPSSEVNGLSEDVTELVRALARVEALEVLVVLQREPDRYWSGPQVASTLRSPGPVTWSLERLAGLGIASVRVGNEIRYRYQPVSGRLARTLGRLASAYEQRRLLVLETLRSVPRRSGNSPRTGEPGE